MTSLSICPFVLDAINVNTFEKHINSDLAYFSVVGCKIVVDITVNLNVITITKVKIIVAEFAHIYIPASVTTLVGALVGGSVGALVGCFVGALVGGSVGILVGCFVGALVGGSVGALVVGSVGTLVGASVDTFTSALVLL